MRRSVSRAIYLSGWALAMVGVGLVIFIQPQPFRAALILVGMGAVLSIIAWIGALVQLARLRRWGWFAVVLLLNIAMPVYIFEGPDEPA